MALGILTFLFLFTDCTIFIFGGVICWNNIVDCLLVKQRIRGYYIWIGTMKNYKKMLASEQKRLDDIIEKRKLGGE